MSTCTDIQALFKLTLILARTRWPLHETQHKLKSTRTLAIVVDMGRNNILFKLTGPDPD